jgi:hypothetical protein
MEVKFNIDNEKIEEVLKNQINGISEEDVKNIILEGFRNWISSEENLKNIITTKTKNYWGHDVYEFNNIIYEAAGKVDLTKIFDGLAEEMIEIIRNNLNEIVVTTFANMFIGGIEQRLFTSGRLNNEINNILSYKISDMIANGELH